MLKQTYLITQMNLKKKQQQKQNKFLNAQRIIAKVRKEMLFFCAKQNYDTYPRCLSSPRTELHDIQMGIYRENVQKILVQVW